MSASFDHSPQKGVFCNFSPDARRVGMCIFITADTMFEMSSYLHTDQILKFEQVGKPGQNIERFIYHADCEYYHSEK